jgi:hypothetical protein
MRRRDDGCTKGFVNLSRDREEVMYYLMGSSWVGGESKRYDETETAGRLIVSYRQV